MIQALRKMLVAWDSSSTSTAPRVTKCSEMQKNLAGGETCQIGIEKRSKSESKHNSPRMVHRGASAADNASGDGAGVLLGLPHSYYCAVLKYVSH